MAEDAAEVLQHYEMTDAGPALCRSENFVPFHAPLAASLRTGPVIEVASALLGQPAVLYKEKVNYKLPGGAGYSPHHALGVPDDQRARLSDDPRGRRRSDQRLPRSRVGVLRRGAADG